MTEELGACSEVENEVGCKDESPLETNEETPAMRPAPRRSARFSQPSQEDLVISIDNDNQLIEDEDLPPTQPEMHLRQACPSLDKDLLNMKADMKDWEVTPLGRAISASLTPFGSCPGAKDFTFYRQASMLRDESDPAYTPGSKVVHSIGDNVLIGWQRNDPKEPQGAYSDQAVCRIMAIFADSSGLLWFIPKWGRCWSDVVNPYSDVDSIEPDDELRGSKEVFWEADKGGPWDHSAPLPLVERGLVSGDKNLIHCITRPCVVRHKDEFETENDFNEYLSGPDSYFYRYSLPHAGPLRFEELPVPGVALEKQILSGPLRMVDVFAGSGCVSDAATHSGWSVSLGVESDFKAFQTYARNCPSGARSQMAVEEFLELVKNKSSEVPGPGDVEWLHLSPPCQSLCQQNAHKGIDRYNDELKPLLNCIRELILTLRPKYVTIEEVPRFLYAELPRVQYTQRKKRKKGK